VNRLATETSPYLRQHRDNPVDWYPWGEEAFARAAELDRPILLSVGYSACHWCHVMAHDCFEDPETAAVMNDLFVNVKVDREERPDVDAIYMDALQTMTGSGGWPMTVWMTPEGRPFFAGTYFPRERFVDLMLRIAAAWRDQRDEIEKQGRQLTEAMGRFASLSPAPGLPAPEVLERAEQELTSRFDPEWAGFGDAPKFPPSMALEFLLRRHLRTGSSTARDMVDRTLDAMAAGGIYDHLGGGFCRYSVDRRWLVPHFEKMLYDQAMLTRVYLHSWQLNGRAAHLQVAEETISYVLDDLGHPEGGFFSAEDADSEGVEGKFYVFTPAEIESALGPLAPEAIEWYGVTDRGNFEGANILHRPLGADLIRPPRIEEARALLLEERNRRVRPGLDDKILTEWNALMISTLAEAGAATGRAEWIDRAERAAEFLLEGLRRDDGRWLRSWQNGRARHLAYAGDYAALVDAFTRLGETTGRARWTELALATAEQMLELFGDHDQGGLWTTGHDAERLVARPKDLLDGPTPSANALAAVALMRLWGLTGREDLRGASTGIIRLLAQPVESHPSGFAHLLWALEMELLGLTEIAVVGDVPGLVTEVLTTYLPLAVVAWGEPFGGPLWESREPGHAYVCEGHTCLAPIDDPEALARTLRETTTTS